MPNACLPSGSQAVGPSGPAPKGTSLSKRARGKDGPRAGPAPCPQGACWELAPGFLRASHLCPLLIALYPFTVINMAVSRPACGVLGVRPVVLGVWHSSALEAVSSAAARDVRLLSPTDIHLSSRFYWWRRSPYLDMKVIPVTLFRTYFCNEHSQQQSLCVILISLGYVTRRPFIGL